MILTTDELRRILPQQFPFLMIDRIEDVKPGESLTAIKNITSDEWVFQDQYFQLDHFPETLLIEAAAQAVLLLYYSGAVKGRRLNVFIGKAKAQFFAQGSPGDQLSIKVSVVKMAGALGYFDANIFVGTERLASIELISGIRSTEA